METTPPSIGLILRRARNAPGSKEGAATSFETRSLGALLRMRRKEAARATF
jgi:hypothetical protein